jgi:Spy/CpxP family protein refolding chaperone
MKRIWITIVTISAMAAGFAVAQTAAPAAAPVKARLQKQLIQSLDLTAAQKQQAKTILQGTKQQAQPLAAQIKQQRQSLNAAIQSGDTAQIQQLSTSLGTLHGQLLAIRSAGKAQFYALLTPDQKTKAAAFEQKVKDVLGDK